jgi:hypothetical protein
VAKHYFNAEVGQAILPEAILPAAAFQRLDPLKSGSAGWIACPTAQNNKLSDNCMNRGLPIVF